MDNDYKYSILNPNTLIEHLKEIIDKIESRRSAAIPAEAMPTVNYVFSEGDK